MEALQFYTCKHSTRPSHEMGHSYGKDRWPIKTVTFLKEKGKSTKADLLRICEHNWQSCLTPQGERWLSKRISYSQPKGNLNSNNLTCVEKQDENQVSDAWCRLCISVVSGAGDPFPQREELLVVDLLALTTPIRVVQRPSSWISVTFSSVTFSQRCENCVYSNLKWNSARNLLFLVQVCNGVIQDGSSTLHLALLSEGRQSRFNIKIYMAGQC